MFQWIARSYAFWHARRGRLAVAACLAGAALALLASRAPMREDIRSLLPDTEDGVAAWLGVLQDAPFAKSVLVDLSAESPDQLPELIRTADAIAEGMPPPRFTHVLTGPDETLQRDLLFWLYDATPLLMTEQDLDQFEARLTPEGMDAQLRENLRALTGPQSMVTKALAVRDPLGLRYELLRKLEALNMAPRARLADGHFVTDDGRHVMLVAQTNVPITDSDGARAVVTAVERLLAEHVGEGITARYVCGHRHAAANAGTIRRDLVRVLPASLGAVALILVLFLPDVRVLMVFFCPLAAAAVGYATVAVAFPAVNAITLGFGGILLGIAADFGLHVFCALRNDTDAPADTLRRLAEPLTLCALTTMGAFGILLMSSMPGQRQLGLLAVAGLAGAWLFALFVLPHFVSGSPRPLTAPRRRSMGPAGRKVVLGAWLAVLVGAGVFAPRVGIDSELQNAGVRDEAILADEQAVARTWGDVRGMGVVASDGPAVADALRVNERVWDVLRHNGLRDGVVNVAPLLPSPATQRANRAAWQEYWFATGRAERIRESLAQRAAPLGFTEDAFDAFFEELAAAPPEPFGLNDLRRAGLGPWFDPLIVEAGGRTRVLSLVPDDPAFLDALASAEAWAALDVIHVSPRMLSRKLGAAVGRDAALFVTLATIAVVGLLTVLLRNVRGVVLSLLPVATGLLTMFGAMGATGTPINLFSAGASLLVIGLGVDYGIFTATNAHRELSASIRRAVLVSGLTTLAGFGALIPARHPALHSLGLSVVLGLAPALATALVVVPLLRRADSYNCTEAPDHD